MTTITYLNIPTHTHPSTPLLTLTSPSFPTELILNTIQQLPFNDGRFISTLSKVNFRLHAVLKNYEYSLIKAIMKNELFHARIDFPCDDKTFGFAWLAECVKRYDVIDDVMMVMISKRNCYAVEEHNMALVNAGFLLLYQLVAIEDHDSKLGFINSLPRDPLTAIFLALHHATLTARYHGTGYIHQSTYGRFMDVNQLSLRNQIECAFAEAALNLGPSFINDILLAPQESNAEIKLLNIYHHFSDHEWNFPGWGDGHGEFMPPMTQGPEVDPQSKKMALFTAVLERLAELMEKPVEEVKSRIEAQTDLPNHSLANIGLWGKERLLQKLDLEN